MADTDYQKSSALTEGLFEATNILIKKQLESLKYDTTIEATIIDDKKASEGMYTVSTGQANFIAYCDNAEYKEKDIVMVTVPQGDYNNHKVIIGKKKVGDKEEKPLNYKSPFLQFADVTGNLIPDSSLTMKGFHANGDSYSWEPSISDFQTQETEPIISQSVSESKYTRVGIKADFATFLNEYQPIQGNYGIAVVLKFLNTTDSTLINDNVLTRTLILDSKDFFGNVYNYKVYQTQEAVFDISEMQNFQLSEIKVYAYQRNNFKKANNDLIYNSIGDTVNRPENIFVKNIYVSMGFDSSEFNKDQLDILTSNDDYYNKDSITEKILNLRWVHKDEDTELIRPIEENDIPTNYEIRWYRFDRDAGQTEKFVSAFWKRLYGYDETNHVLITNQTQDNATNKMNIAVYLDGSKETERFQALVIKKNNLTVGSSGEDYEVIARSPIKEFHNRVEIIQKPDGKDINALSIRFDDTGKGHYFIYNKAGKVSKSQHTETKTLTAVYSPDETSVYAKPQLDIPYSKIAWSFPINNTMITPILTGASGNEIPLTETYFDSLNPNSNDEVTYQNITIRRITQDSNKTFVLEYVKAENDVDTSQTLITVKYKIAENLNYNANRNTISLEVIKDGQVCMASADMRFGTSGTSGSDYTIVIDWENNENAFDVNEGELSGTVKLLDQAGNEVILDNNAQYSYSWSRWSKGDTQVNNKYLNEQLETVNEKRDLYYPIIHNFNNNNTGGLDCLYYSCPGMNSGYHYYDLPGDNNINLTYWISYDDSNLDLSSLAIYDIDKKDFVLLSSLSNIDETYRTNHILYGKFKNNYNSNRKKIEFKKIDKIVTNGMYQGHYGVIRIDTQGKSTYYYCGGTNYNDNLRRAFIKYNDTYIIDPWNEYKETETYYYPVYSEEKNYNSFDSYLLNINFSNDNNQRNFTITDKDNGITNTNRQIDSSYMNDLYILKVTLTNFSGFNYKNGLVAEFPIALKNSDNNNDFIVDYIEGPTDVRYSTSGETDFNKNPYQIAFRVKTNSGYSVYKQGYDSSDSNFGHWKLIYEQNNQKEYTLPSLVESENEVVNIGDNTYINFLNTEIIDAFITKLKTTIAISVLLYAYQNCSIDFSNLNTSMTNLINKLTNDYIWRYQTYIREIQNKTKYEIEQSINRANGLREFFLAAIDEDRNLIASLIDKLKEFPFYQGDLPIALKPILSPPNVYFKNTPLYGIKFIIDKNLPSDNNVIIPAGKVLWTQPIYVYQDNYPSTTLNKWNGSDIITDNETGIISASGFSAGKKEDDNTFTGVIIGDWSRTDSDTMLIKETGVYGFNHGAMSYALKDDGTAFFGADGQGRIYFDGNNAKIYSSSWISLQKDNYNNPILDASNNTYKQKQCGIMMDLDDGLLEVSVDNNGSKATLLHLGPDNQFLRNKDATISESTLTKGLQIDLKTGTFEIVDTPFTLKASNKEGNNIIANIEFSTDINNDSLFSIYGTINTPTIQDKFASAKQNRNFIRIHKSGGGIASTHFMTQIKDSSDYYRYGPTGLQIDLTNDTLYLGGGIEDNQGDGLSDPYGGSIHGMASAFYPGASSQNSIEYDHDQLNHAGYYDREFVLKPWGNYLFIANKQFRSSDDKETLFSVDWNGNITCDGDITCYGTIKCKDFEYLP